MSSVTVKNFRKRLDDVTNSLIHETFEVNGEHWSISKARHIYNAMTADRQNRQLLREAGTPRKWERALQSDNVPREYLAFIYTLYPQLRGILEGSIEAFNAYIAPMLAARLEWERAASHLAMHRHELNSVAKQYYASVDETHPDFPLVAKREWILDQPLLLEDLPCSELRDLHFGVPMPPDPTLKGLDINAMTLRSSLTLSKRLRRAGQPFWNGLTYRVVDIAAEGGGLRFEFAEGTYFDYVNSCEARALELARADLLSPGNPDPLEMPIRVAPSDIYNFLGRQTFAGVNCLTILKNYKEPNAFDGAHDVYLIHERGDSLMEAQNCIHVVPAGGHQPLSNDSGDKASAQVWRTAAREFLEELRNHIELDQHMADKTGMLDDPLASGEFNALFRPDTKGQRIASIYLLGAGLDPVTTKPEILVAIVMDWERALASNERIKLTQNYEGRARPIRFVSSIEGRKAQLLAEAQGRSSSGPHGGHLPALAAGAACFLLAAKNYEILMGVRA